MPKVKICGIRRTQDVSYVNKYLPEYVGFIFAESRRRVSGREAKELSAGLDGRIKRVGIFVNETIDKVIETTVDCGLDVLQIHGDEQPGYFLELGSRLSEVENKPGKRMEVWKAIRVRDEGSIKQMPLYPADAFVLDAFVEGTYGGAGKSFDWKFALEAGKHGKVILAGGLDSFNAWKAIGTVRPFALDISSGVETDGRKDEAKIREFINVVRSYG